MVRNTNGPTTQIRVVPDLERLSREAAEQFAQLAEQQVQGSGRFSVALSGGSTPQRLYELLASEPYRSRIPWDQAHVFWADERCVPSDHLESNFRMANDMLLSRVPLPSVNVYRIPADQGDPVSAAASYEHTLRAFFRLQHEAWPEFDLVLLGVGKDGHTASLFPGSPALHETHRLVVATVGGTPNVPRISLTVPVFNHAKHLVWLVSGVDKAAVVRAILAGPEQPDELPAEMIRPVRGSSVWLLDRAAASLLQRSPSHDPRR